MVLGVNVFHCVLMSDVVRHRYMKYLYPYECERRALSSPSELQAAIDSNRREGRRPSYSNSMFRFSPSPGSAPHILAPPSMHLSALGMGAVGNLNGFQACSGSTLKKGLGQCLISTKSCCSFSLLCWDDVFPVQTGSWDVACYVCKWLCCFFPLNDTITQTFLCFYIFKSI